MAATTEAGRAGWCADVMYLLLDEAPFEFQGIEPGGQLTPLTTAFERYRTIFSPPLISARRNSTDLLKVKDFHLIVEVTSADASLSLETDKSCKKACMWHDVGNI